jgi:hypothetical protein
MPMVDKACSRNIGKISIGQIVSLSRAFNCLETNAIAKMLKFLCCEDMCRPVLFPAYKEFEDFEL